jgi:hypothetical protein
MQPLPHAPGSESWVRDIGRRVGVSALVWCGFGVVAGVSIAPELTPIGLVAGVIAGVVVLTPIGVVMGLIGGRWMEMLVGGAVGTAAGVVAALLQSTALGQPVALGLISGGLVGSTFVTTFWRLPRLVRRLVRPHPSDDRVKQSVLA